MNTYSKCIVYGCLNKPGDGRFMGELCAPCYKTITQEPSIKKRDYSQMGVNIHVAASMLIEKQAALQDAVASIESLEDMANLPAWYKVKEALKCK